MRPFMLLAGEIRGTWVPKRTVDLDAITKCGKTVFPPSEIGNEPIVIWEVRFADGTHVRVTESACERLSQAWKSE
jgi:hypothetical protein